MAHEHVWRLVEVAESACAYDVLREACGCGAKRTRVAASVKLEKEA